MDDRIVQFRVGVTVLAALFITGILMVLFGGLPNLRTGSYNVMIRFDDAPGIAQDSPVRKSGKLIGRVRTVDFDDDGTILVQARIDGDVKLYRQEQCRISTTLLGAANLEFVRGNVKPSPEDLVHEGDVMQGSVQSSPLDAITNLEGGLSEAIESVAKTSEEVGRLARELADLVNSNQEPFGRVVVKAEQSLDTIRKTAENFQEFFDDPELRDALKSSLQELPAVLGDLRDAVEGIKSTVASADKNLRNLEGLTQPLGEQGEEIVSKLNQTLGRVDGLFENLNNFTESLNRSEGTLGMLMNDPSLYQNLDRAAENIADLTRQVRPIMHDARVLMDKLSRDPGGEIGVRGALNRRSGIK